MADYLCSCSEIYLQWLVIICTVQPDGWGCHVRLHHVACIKFDPFFLKFLAAKLEL